MLPEAAVQLQLLGFAPPPPGVNPNARRELIRQAVLRRERKRRELRRLIAARCWRLR
ncbi:hypothetical protein K1W54_04760 [Micromonospora sp. CPCC 205371]|nr:hypothetical protein [Micromonospora sp. CPCC 205371]